MRPFDFILVFFSLIYAVALTHILLAATNMIRHRRRLIFSWPHALWMSGVFLLVSVNWLSVWDLRTVPTFNLEVIASNFVLVIGQYFVCALVSPDFLGEDGYDLKKFHARERGTYLGAYLALVIFGFFLNILAALSYGLASWGQQNAMVIGLLAAGFAAAFINRAWVQIAAPLLVIALMIAFPIIYYPVLR